MKKSQLKQFIKEEILNVLKESVNEDIKVGNKFTTIDYGKTYNWWVTKEDDGLIELDNNNPRWSKFGLATKEFEGLVKSGQFIPVKESVNEAKAKIGSKIKVYRDEWDKKPLTMTLGRKIPNDDDDAYEATYETDPIGMPKRSQKFKLEVAYGMLPHLKKPIWFLLDPSELEDKRTPYKESINEVQQTFDGLIQLAKKVRGFKQVSKQGFSIPYEYGNVEFHDEGYEGSVGVYWYNNDGSDDEDNQPLSVAYRIVKGKI